MNTEQPAGTVTQLAWFKSSYSTGSGGERVEVAAGVGVVHVRDTKDKARALVNVAPSAWVNFVGFAVRQ